MPPPMPHRTRPNRAPNPAAVTLCDHGPIRMAKLAASERPDHHGGDRRLVTLRLVRRSPDPADLRSVLVDITSEDLTIQRQSLANHRANAVTLLSRLSQAELDALTKTLAPLERLADGADRRTTATSVGSALSPSAMLSRPAPRASGR
jgi:hypothetical protein